MEAHLNRIDGVDDAIITMYLSKRNARRGAELGIRRLVMECSATGLADSLDADVPIGALRKLTPELKDYLDKLFKWGVHHITMLRFIDLSFMVYGMHRGGQDDVDAHNYRMNNRIIRASTRLADIKHGEMSEFYQGKIVPTDVALEQLGIELPHEIERDGDTYVKAVNGYILKGHENDRDYKRGLYMMSWPSDFIFRMNLTEYAHFYKMRNSNGTANPEVKKCVEDLTDQIEKATMGYVTRELLKEIEN